MNTGCENCIAEMKKESNKRCKKCKNNYVLLYKLRKEKETKQN